MKKLSVIVSLFAIFAFSGTAMAIPFDVSGGTVLISDIQKWGWTGIKATTVSGLEDTAFNLGAGGSYTFDFFNITTGGLGFGNAHIVATLAFSDPLVTTGEGDGTVGWATFLGVVSGFNVTWDTQPQTITLASGESFDIAFADVSTNVLGNSTTVQATVTTHAAPVPEPSTILLLGSGLIGLWGVRRKMKK